MKATHNVCRACYNKAHVKRMALRKKLWKDWLSQNVDMKCQECGYDKYKAAIDFHHKDPSEKEFAIGNWTGGRYAFNESNIQKVLDEINKCDVLCANCHRGLHANYKEK